MCPQALIFCGVKCLFGAWREPYLVPIAGSVLELAQVTCDEAQNLIDRVPNDQHMEWFQRTALLNAECSNLIENEARTEFIDGHRQAELAMEKAGFCGRDALCSTALREVHERFYLGIPGPTVEPGAWRKSNVQIQNHVPPRWEAVPQFLKRIDEVYLRPGRSMAELLVAVAAAHHRCQWVHPFEDGNGRAVRLQSQLALRPLGSSFWSLSRGLFIRRESYYQMLAVADTSRLSDLDGRGNLSERRLIDWVQFFISVCRKEIQWSIDRL